MRDYTEFQSQLLERWLMTDPVIDNYLVHVETGEPIPAELVSAIRRADSFNQGFATTEYLASALVDMMYHTSDPTDLDADAFERASLALLGMPDAIVMRHRSPHFGHALLQRGLLGRLLRLHLGRRADRRRRRGVCGGARRLLRPAWRGSWWTICSPRAMRSIRRRPTARSAAVTRTSTR